MVIKRFIEGKKTLLLNLMTLHFGSTRFNKRYEGGYWQRSMGESCDVLSSGGPQKRVTSAIVSFGKYFREPAVIRYLNCTRLSRFVAHLIGKSTFSSPREPAKI